MIAGMLKVIDGVTCNATATVYSSINSTFSQTDAWIPCQSGESFSIWVTAASAGGTCNLDTYADLTPLGEDIAYNSTDTSKYVSVKLDSSALAADDTLTRYTSATLTNADLDYPFRKMRIRVVGSATNPADTVVTVYLTLANRWN